METLRAALDEARSCDTRLVLLTGEPGIGKTRLAEEFAAEAARGGVVVLYGRCWEGEGSPAFWPWIQIIRAHFHGRPATGAAGLGAGAGDILQLVPELARSGPPTSPLLGEHLTPEESRFRLFDSFASFLKRASATQPLVLILDDIQWADRASLLLLRFLAAELREANVLILGTCRDSEPEEQPEVAAALSDVARHPITMIWALRGLNERDVARLIAANAGTIVSDSLVAAISEQTNGNAFFIQETVRLLVAERRIGQLDSMPHPSLPIPLTVREVITRRVGSLSATCRSVLAVASVLGCTFELRLLERVVDLDLYRLLETLDEAVASRVLVGETSGQYRFAHGLVQEFFYESLPTPQRLALHARVGETIEVFNDPDLVDAMAHHFLEALPSGNIEKALRYSVQAGQRAMSVLAYEEAAGHYEHAIRACGMTTPNPRQRCQLLLTLGGAYGKAGVISTAREVFQEATTLARGIQDPELLARAALGSGEPWSGPGHFDDTLVPLLEEAHRALLPKDSTLHARVLARLAIALYLSPSETRRMDLSRQAVRMAKAVGDSATELFALGAMHYALCGPEHSSERLAIADETMHLARNLGDSEMFLRARLCRGADFLELGNGPAADLEFDTCTRLAATLRQPYYRWYAAVLQTARALMAGQFSEGEKLAYEAFSLGQSGQIEPASHYFAAQLYLLHFVQGRLCEIESMVGTLADDHPEIPAFRAAYAHLLVHRNQRRRASEAFSRIAGMGFADIPENGFRLVTLGLLAEVSVALNSSVSADQLYELLIPHADRCVVVGIGGVCDGSVSRHLGMLAAGLSREADARRHFEHALTVNMSLGSPPLVARTRLAYAEMLFAGGTATSKREAHDLLSYAMRTFEDLGMSGCLEMARTLYDKLERRGAPHSDLDREAMEAKANRSANNVLKREGQYWTVVYEGITARLRDSRGLQYIAFLLQHPGQEFHVLDLVAGETSPRSRAASGDTGPMLDPQARREYKRRLAELREELEEAERHNDSGRALRRREEIDAITEQLAAALGAGGRSRRAGSAAERARVNVRNSITNAIKNIRQYNKPLWRHLTGSIKTGTVCLYWPERPAQWEL